MEKTITDLLTNCQYKYKDLCKRDITSALGYFKELTPRPEKYVYPNGQVKELITLVGTIPVNFKNNRYNIPVQLYLSDLHPYTPPIAYVRPTSDMSINVSKTVDSNGRIMLPCLTEWNYPHSDLYMLLNFMTITFSENTPLFAKSTKPPAASVVSNVQSYGASGSTNSGTSALPYPTDPRPPYPTSGVNNGYNTGIPTYPMPGTGYAYGGQPTNDSSLPSYSNAITSSNNPYYPMNQLKSTSSSNIAQARPVSSTLLQTNNSSGYQDDTIKPEYYRMSLISAIQDKLRPKYNENMDAKMAEIDSLKRVNNDLKESQSYLDNLISDATVEISTISNLTQQLRAKSDQLIENLNRIQHRDRANVDDAVVTPMPLYRQIFQLYAEELAIQDLIYYLSEGLSRNSVTLENFLKQIRLLTRKQFMLRATMQKAREKAALPL